MSIAHRVYHLDTVIGNHYILSGRGLRYVGTALRRAADSRAISAPQLPPRGIRSPRGALLSGGGRWL